VSVPFGTTVGTTYRITASDGRLTAAGQVTVYAPTIAVSCGNTNAAVSVAGSGWPPSARYALRSPLLPAPLSGMADADGTFLTTFTPPPGVLPGEYQVSANAGSLLAETQVSTLR